MRLASFSSLAVALSLTLLAGCSSSSSNAQNTTGDDSGTGDDSAPQAPAYPDGPYGLTKGMVFPNVSYQGLKDGTGAMTTISMSDFYDPDGSKGITGIYFIVSAKWCGPCNIEGHNLPTYYPKVYKARGAVFVNAFIEDDYILDAQGNPTGVKPATEQTLRDWSTKYHTNYDMLLAPSDPSTGATPLLPVGKETLPHNYTINPRNMQVHAEIGGVADTAAWGCNTTADCCQVGVTKYTDGSNVCDVPYTCRPSGICLTDVESSPIPSLDFIMVQNGAQPIAK